MFEWWGFKAPPPDCSAARVTNQPNWLAIESRTSRTGHGRLAAAIAHLHALWACQNGACFRYEVLSTQYSSVLPRRLPRQ
jgi:hypothetical protein